MTYLGLFYSHREKSGQCNPLFQHVCPCWSAHTTERLNTEAPSLALLLEGSSCPLKAGISLCMSKAPSSAVTPQHFSRSVTDPLSAILAPRIKLSWFFCCFVSNKYQISRAILEKVWCSSAKKNYVLKKDFCVYLTRVGSLYAYSCLSNVLMLGKGKAAQDSCSCS